MQINSKLDSGNIEVIQSDDSGAILKIRDDSNAEFKQWFHFHVQGEVGKKYQFVIDNAGDCSYEKGWEDYQAVASYDGEHWFRVATEYKDKKLNFSHELACNSIYFAYFAPYSYQRHRDLIHNAQMAINCQHLQLGTTVDGRGIDLLVIGEEVANSTKKKIWITARQHPGETMAEWSAEAMIERLLDDNDPVSRRLLQESVFYIVPNMNPDGSVRGNLRANAAGANLNREWLEPSLERSPEVYYVREKMLATGVDGHLDLHGDEGLPYVFMAAGEGNPSYNEKIAALENKFSETLIALNPDFQTQYGYPKDEPGKSDLRIASNWVGEQFGCLALTIEMPFKDNANLPNIEMGWSAERSYIFGVSLVAALYQTLIED